MLWATVVAFVVAAWSGRSSCSCCRTRRGPGRWACWAPRRSSAAARPTGPGYFSLLAQMVAVGGMLLFGMIMIWLFGREFADRTAKDLLALPTSRAAVVVAKLVVALVWSLLLTVGGGGDQPRAGSGAGLARLVGPGASPRGRCHRRHSVLTVLLATTYALAASWGRGYLAAVATLFVTAITAQIVSAVGYGAWFPWAVPSLMSGVAGPDQATPGAGRDPQRRAGRRGGQHRHRAVVAARRPRPLSVPRPLRRGRSTSGRSRPRRW